MLLILRSCNFYFFLDWTDGFDVGLIFLKEDAILSEDVQLASLPNCDEECPSGNSLTLSGWGRDPFKGESHHILWAVKQGCLDIKKCDLFDYPRNSSPVLCVGDKNDPRNSGFKGDSGGKSCIRSRKFETFCSATKRF